MSKKWKLFTLIITSVFLISACSSNSVSSDFKGDMLYIASYATVPSPSYSMNHKKMTSDMEKWEKAYKADKLSDKEREVYFAVKAIMLQTVILSLDSTDTTAKSTIKSKVSEMKAILK